MYSVRKGVELGMDNWDDIVKAAIDILPIKKGDNDSNDFNSDNSEIRSKIKVYGKIINA